MSAKSYIKIRKATKTKSEALPIHIRSVLVNSKARSTEDVRTRNVNPLSNILRVCPAEFNIHSYKLSHSLRISPAITDLHIYKSNSYKPGKSLMVCSTQNNIHVIFTNKQVAFSKRSRRKRRKKRRKKTIKN